MRDKCPIAPNLAIKVISCNDTWEDVNDNVHEYFADGVRQVWLISPEHKHVYVYGSPTRLRILTEEEDLTDEELLPGFRCRLIELFQT